MPIQWNFLNPDMRPLSENFIQGANQGLQQRRFAQDLAEQKRQFDAREPYRQAIVTQLQNQIARQKEAERYYNWAMGGQGEMLQRPYSQEEANRVLLNPFITNYLGIPAGPAPTMITL